MNTTIEVRQQDDDTAIVTGTASVYNTWYPVGGRFEERVMPGAGTATLACNPHVIFTGQHDYSRAVASTPRTLLLNQDERGLHYRAILDLRDPDALSLYTKIKRGDVTESSVGFKIPKEGQTWNADYTQRTIHRYSLDRGDVSAVPFAASPTTNVTTQRTAANWSLEQRSELAQVFSRSGLGGPFADETLARTNAEYRELERRFERQRKAALERAWESNWTEYDRRLDDYARLMR